MCFVLGHFLRTCVLTRRIVVYYRLTPFNVFFQTISKRVRRCSIIHFNVLLWKFCVNRENAAEATPDYPCVRRGGLSFVWINGTFRYLNIICVERISMIKYFDLVRDLILNGDFVCRQLPFTL